MSAFGPEDLRGHDSWIDSFMQFAPIGASAAIIRAMLSEEKHTWGWNARRTIAASLTAWMAGPALAAYITDFNVMLLAVGAVSYAGPEVWDGLLRGVKKVIPVIIDWVSKLLK